MVPPLPPPLLPPSLSSSSDPSSGLPKKDLFCKNCKSCGLRGVRHIDTTCFQPGGDMEGCCDEYKLNKGHVHAMLAECLEHAFSLAEDDAVIVPSLPSPSPTLLPASDSDTSLPSIANLCVNPFLVNSDFLEDTYIPCDLKPISPFAFTSTSPQHIALLSLGDTFNALLDSGCTNHIVCDRSLFHSYVPQEISVGTTNCGSLAALRTGDVKFRYSTGEKQVLFTLKGCLFTPTAPINLLSVSALVEHGFNCLFSPGGVTNLFYPDSHPRLPGLSIPTTVLNRLSFFKLDFLSPVLSPPSVAFPVGVAPPHLAPLLDPSVSCFEVFTFPHVFHAESELSKDSPRNKIRLNSDFFWLMVQPILKIRVQIYS